MAIKLRQIRNFNELWSKAQSIYDFQPHAQNSYDQNYYNLQCLRDIILQPNVSEVENIYVILSCQRVHSKLQFSIP